jgi:hypothetical protein
LRKSNSLLLACALATFALSCSIPNSDYVITIVNPNSKIGSIIVDGQPMDEVYSESLFSPATVTLEGRLIPGLRTFFDGFDFSYQSESIDGPSLAVDIVRTSPVTFVPSSDRRFATARFFWNSYVPEYFVADSAVLYLDDRGGRQSLRLMPVAGGDRAAASQALISSDLDGSLNPNFESWSPIVCIVDFHSEAGYTAYLWSNSTPQSAPLDVAAAMGLPGGDFEFGIGATGATAFGNTTDGSGNQIAALAFFDATKGYQPAPALPRNAGDDYSFTASRDGEAALVQVGNSSSGSCNLAVGGTTFSVGGRYKAFFLARGPGVNAAQVKRLFQFDSSVGSLDVADLLVRDSSGNPLAILDVFEGFSPDTAHLALLRPGKALPGGTTALVALDDGGNAIIKVNAELGESYAFFRWSADGSRIEGSTDQVSWNPIPGTDRVPVAVPQRDPLVSPSGLMRLDSVTTSGPIDVFLDSVGSPAGSGHNLTLEDEKQ